MSLMGVPDSDSAQCCRLLEASPPLEKSERIKESPDSEIKEFARVDDTTATASSFSSPSPEILFEAVAPEQLEESPLVSVESV